MLKKAKLKWYLVPVLIGVLTLGLFAPAPVWAGPPPGSIAPDVSIPDTAWVLHTIPSEYRGHVVQLFFWQST